MLIAFWTVPSRAEPATSRIEADEIVVVARRSGAPVWTVTRDGRRLILVGTIEGVSKETRWSPASLETALSQATRLTFPDTQAVEASIFSMFGYLAKWRRQATLPKGTTLDQLLTPEQLARVAALQRRGLIGSDYRTRHPFHLALAIRGRMKGSGYGPDAAQIGRRIAKRKRIAVVPLATTAARPLADEFFRSPPSQHVGCLMAAVALAEAGPGAVRARSDAWAGRRVNESLNSVAEGVYQRCWPSGSAYDITPANGLAAAIGRLLDQPGLTVGIVSLAALGSPGGVLDRLAASGYTIDGPAWK